ncbi:CHAT domain-containing protein, partial [Roridomyces roridus]
PNHLKDLQNSVSAYERAVKLAPDGHPEKAARLASLGSCLFTRCVQLDSIDDLHRSLSLAEDAVRVASDDHPDKPMTLTNLGELLIQRHKKLGDLKDLLRSVSVRKKAVQLTPNGHPSKAVMLMNLGASLLKVFLYNKFDMDALREAKSVHQTAACLTTGPADIRFDSASRWAICCSMLKQSPMEAWQIALNLLPELAWLGLSIPDRHRRLEKAGRIVRDAAASALAAGRPETAVEWLEQGRSVIWGQLLSLRTPLDALKDKDPHLAGKLIALSAQLERSGTRNYADKPQQDSGPSPQLIAEKAFEAAHQRDKLIKEIRKLSGFERFLLPKTISELSIAAQGGPVVILNVSSMSSDAFILIPGMENEVMHIPLLGFKQQYNYVEGLAKSIGKLVGRNTRLKLKQEDQVTSDEQFQHMLSSLWTGIVKPILNGLAFNTPKKSAEQRIWWCLTGSLTFLPIHAAGIYGKEGTLGSKISDYVISSYTPSLTALIEGQRPHSVPPNTFEILAVAQPTASGQIVIPETRTEIKHIERIAQGREIPVVTLMENTATLAAVQEKMKQCQWAHFACHGVQNADQPTESALLLAGDSRLTLSKIIQLALPNADFVFLSACQTAMGDSKLQEESVHLAAGMLLAGYKGVIATMWTIMDQDAPQVAKDVYGHMLEVSPPDTTKAAEALHIAIQKLREGPNGKSFLHWVPYIHFGV